MAARDQRSIQDRTNCAILPHAPASIAGREADELTIVRWVARNIDVPSPDPSSCPDPFAWSLLRECRETPGFVSDHFLPLWAKLIPPRSQLADTKPKGAVDGQAQLDLIGRILAHRRASEPEPEPVNKRPSAFEAFDPNKEG